MLDQFYYRFITKFGVIIFVTIHHFICYSFYLGCYFCCSYSMLSFYKFVASYLEVIILACGLSFLVRVLLFVFLLWFFDVVFFVLDLCYHFLLSFAPFYYCWKHDTLPQKRQFPLISRFRYRCRYQNFAPALEDDKIIRRSLSFVPHNSFMLLNRWELNKR